MSRLRFGRFDYAAFLSFFAYAAGSVVVPVALVEIARDLAFDLEAGGMGRAGLLHLGRTVAMVAAMLTCGVLAGRWGKRRTLGWAVAVMCVGVGACGFSPTYAVLLMALVVAGLGEGVVEGLATPFVAALHPGDSGRYVNFSHSFWSVGVLVAVLGTGGVMALGAGWRWPVVATAVAGLGAAAMILWPASGERAYPESGEASSAGQVWRHARGLLGLPRFWRYFAAMFAAGGGEFCLTFWVAAFIQLTFTDNAWAGGVGTGCFALGMFLGRAGAGVWVGQRHLKALILVSSAAGVAVTLVLPWVSSLTALLPLLLLSGLATAPYWPSIQSLATERLEEHDSTTLLILLSCAGVPGCGVLTWLLGVVADASGDLRAAFLLVPGCYLAVLGLIAIDRRSGVATEASAGEA